MSNTIGRMDHIGKAVRSYLAASGASQSSFAQAIGLGRCALADRLRGRTRWSLDDARRVAELLDIDLADLLIGPEQEVKA